jgi:hypothetical protein
MAVSRLALAALAAALAAIALGAQVAAAATPSQAIRFIRLSGGGDYFLNYDGKKNLSVFDRDWGVSMIFYSDASVNRVKGFYDEERGYNGRGSREWEPYRYSSRIRMDGDKGKKTDCNSAHTDNHFRVYGGYNDRFYDPRYGYYVVATTHLDHGDGGGTCAASETYFGYSENVEHDLAVIANPALTVHEDYKNLRNAEPLRLEGDHWWQSDGKATLVLMP